MSPKKTSSTHQSTARGPLIAKLSRKDASHTSPAPTNTRIGSAPRASSLFGNASIDNRAGSLSNTPTSGSSYVLGSSSQFSPPARKSNTQIAPQPLSQHQLHNKLLDDIKIVEHKMTILSKLGVLEMNAGQHMQLDMSTIKYFGHIETLFEKISGIIDEFSPHKSDKLPLNAFQRELRAFTSSANSLATNHLSKTIPNILIKIRENKIQLENEKQSNLAKTQNVDQCISAMDNIKKILLPALNSLINHNSRIVQLSEEMSNHGLSLYHTSISSSTHLSTSATLLDTNLTNTDLSCFASTDYTFSRLRNALVELLTSTHNLIVKNVGILTKALNPLDMTASKPVININSDQANANFKEMQSTMEEMIEFSTRFEDKTHTSINNQKSSATQAALSFINSLPDLLTSLSNPYKQISACFHSYMFAEASPSSKASANSKNSVNNRLEPSIEDIMRSMGIEESVTNTKQNKKNKSTQLTNPKVLTQTKVILKDKIHPESAEAMNPTALPQEIHSQIKEISDFGSRCTREFKSFINSKDKNSSMNINFLSRSAVRINANNQLNMDGLIKKLTDMKGVDKYYIETALNEKNKFQLECSRACTSLQIAAFLENPSESQFKSLQDDENVKIRVYFAPGEKRNKPLKTADDYLTVYKMMVSTRDEAGQNFIDQGDVEIHEHRKEPKNEAMVCASHFKFGHSNAALRDRRFDIPKQYLQNIH